MSPSFPRRHLLKSAAAVAMAATLPASSAEPRQTPAQSQSEKTVRLAFIGVGGRGSYLLKLALGLPGVEVPMLCDINSTNLDKAQALVEKEGRKRPIGFSDGPLDYRHMLARDDLDAVIIATPVLMHGPMAIDALKAKKHTLSEVGAAMTIDECWGLVRAEQDSGRIYVLAENCCYTRSNLAVLNMARRGIFGDITYAECGYAHDMRPSFFAADGSITWRGEIRRDYIGNIYPTHAIGPVGQWMGINRGDRFVSLTSFMAPGRSIARYIEKKFPPDHPARKMQFLGGDSTTTLIRTAKGAVIDVRHDTTSARPHVSTTWFGLQGETASYKDDGEKQQIWIEGKNKKYAFEPLTDHIEPYDAPLWKENAEAAMKTGHGGCDWFAIPEFLRAIRTGTKSPIGAVDAATWSSIIPLSAASIKAAGAPQEIPDFTNGAWEKRAG